jgi:hypothetical protein
MFFLYKYYGNIKYALDAIINKKLYFALPSELNDPFDCLPKFSFISCKNDGVEQWRELLCILERFVNPKISEIELQSKIKNTLHGCNYPSVEWLKSADLERHAELEKILSDIRICCFSRCPRNQMMWAHYAKNHHGVVLQFRQRYMVDGDTGELKSFPVEYYRKAVNLKQYISIVKKGITEPLEYAKFMYCSKSEEWAGEKEVRFFSKKKYVSFPESMVTGILFGSKTPMNIIDKFDELISEWTSKPRLLKENLEESKHKMIFNLLKS